LWLERAVDVAPPGLVRRKLIAGAAHVAGRQGEYERAITLFEQALQLNRDAGDTFGTAICLHALSSPIIGLGDHARASALLDEAQELLEEFDDWRRAAAVIHDKGLLALQEGDTRQARDLLERELSILRARGRGYVSHTGNALADLGLVALVDGRDDDASESLRGAITICKRLGDRANVAECLAWLAAVAQRRGDLDRGARLAAAADRLFRELDILSAPYARDLYDATVSAARKRGEAWEEGSSMTVDEAVDEAVSL